MRIRMKRLIFSLSMALYACGGPGSEAHLGPDATQVAQQTVCGQALPTTAPPQISVAAIASTFGLPEVNLSGATAELWRAGDAAPAASQTLGIDARISIAASTANVPLDGFLRVSLSPHWLDGYWFPAAPFAADTVRDEVVSLMAHGNYLSMAGSVPDPTRAWIYVMPADCNGAPTLVANVATTAPGANVRYPDENDYPSSVVTPLSTFVLIDAPPGPITITVTPANPALTMRTIQIDARANMLAIADVLPE
jgi:hypothetical protein